MVAENRAAPGWAHLLCAFANTLDVDVDADPAEALPDPAALTVWLGRHGLIDGGDPADHDDLGIALALRSGLREAMACHGARRSAAVPALDTATADLPLRVVFDSAGPRLAPALGGVRGGLAQIVVAMAEARAAGAWGRLKLCVAQDCLLAFHDGSKNRSRHWCSMGECGNRAKTRTYRARQRREESV